MSCGRLVRAWSYYKTHLIMDCFLSYDSSNSWIFKYGSSSFDFCMTTHTRVRIVCKVGDNRTACRCHDIQFSEQQWNDYGINTCRIRTHTIRHRRLHVGHETKQEHGHTSSFAQLDDVLHIIRQEHPEQTLCSFRDTYVLQSMVSYLIFLVSLPAFRLCGRGDVRGC